jgi:hypothetical protein
MPGDNTSLKILPTFNASNTPIMKKLIPPFAIILLISTLMQAQVCVVDIADLKDAGTLPALADVNGKVLVHESFKQSFAAGTDLLSNIQLYPSWPLN